MNTVLWFSGGKDSMACLYLMRAQLNEIAVLWANTGKNYPEALEVIERAKSMCPHWHEVITDRDGQWKHNGLPSDVVPIDWTAMGQMLSDKKPVTVQSYLGCCFENITGPLVQKTRELGATTVIKGQRADEPHRSTARSGETHDGLTFLHPIEDWTAGMVLAFLKCEMGELPQHYQLEHSSLDCYDCTAFSAHSQDRIQWMRQKHPDLFEEFARNHFALTHALETPLKALYGAIH